ncbi:hypothetical protein, partial [Burkholderia cenocepacia]|uniref:hypothetical protein n=1 Tax=Burkholderia cenocepacia TaxID=95486 RepID=UPI002238B48F
MTTTLRLAGPTVGQTYLFVPVGMRDERKRHFMAAWTELKPVSKVMPVTSSDGDYFGHTECETIEPQGP